MNKICENCINRVTRHVCEGKDGDFKYCSWTTGVIKEIPRTLVQFNTLEELQEKSEFLSREAFDLRLCIEKNCPDLQPYALYGYW